MSHHRTGPPEWPDDVVAIDRELTAFLAAFAALDWETFRSYFADDAVVFFPLTVHPRRADGRDEIERLFHDVFERARTESRSPEPPFLDLRPLDVHIRCIGDGAVVTFHLKDPGILCRRTLILQRMATGWKIVHLHASNLPFPAALPPFPA